MIKKILKLFLFLPRKYLINLQNLYQRLKIKKFFKKIIGKNKLVFDIGANLGAKTEIFYLLDNKIIAVEPQKKLCEIMKNKFINNNSVTIVNKGVGACEGIATLHIPNRYDNFASLIPDWQKDSKYYNEGRKEKIVVTTLEDLVNQYGIPYFCKIDVEGFELEVFKGLQTKIPCLNFEYHGNDFELIKKCLERLNEIGFKTFNFIEGEGNFKLKKWINKDSLLEILENNIKINPKIWGDIYAK